GRTMLVVMHSHATPEQVEQVLQAIRRMNLTPHPMPGATRTAIGITGNIGAIDPRLLEVLPGVSELLRVTKPYKLASREMHEADTYVKLPQTTIGPGTFTLIAAPCSVEDEDMILRTAAFLRGRGVRPTGAGSCKPGRRKRGLAATREGWLMGAGGGRGGGNYSGVLCERSGRTCPHPARNALDLTVIPPSKHLSHRPILVDPSHGTGKRDY